MVNVRDGNLDTVLIDSHAFTVAALNAVYIRQFKWKVN